MADPDSTSVTDDRSLLLRAIWFLLIGWWATGIWLGIAWVLLVLVITIPLGIKMINLTPLILSLKAPQRDFAGEAGDGRLQSTQQRSLVVRGVWFVFVGWWASLLWMGIAYLFTVSIIGIPVAIWMYGKLPFVVSLYEY